MELEYALVYTTHTDDVPREYINMLVQEFAYNPIRLAIEEDPTQILYNHRTIKRIWDTNHEAINPYTH